jgi:hypothetical protein
MIDIQWKGKVGYGDIVSPICYAHNLSYKLGERVDLTFRWDSDCTKKIHPSDPETLWERASYLFSKCTKDRTNVNLIHKFNKPLSINHTNYDWDIIGGDRFHNYWVPVKENKNESNVIVVNSTDNNVMSLSQYGKSWKDPIADNWLYLVVSLKEQGFEVVTVDYRTPIDYLYNTLLTAKGFIGYHGTAAWVARMTHTPSILFSQGGSLTKNAFFSATIHKGADEIDRVLNGVEGKFLLARNDIATHRDDYFRKYAPGVKFLRSLTHGV